MISKRNLAEIVVLRGLGYTQDEIADRLSISKSTVWYHLNATNKKAKNKGNTSTFIGVLTQGYLPEVIRKLKLLEKLG